MATNSGQTQDQTDEEILADPSAFAAEKVLDVFSRSTPDQIAAAKTNEQGGKARVTILEYVQPAAEAPADDVEPRFTRERLVGDDGPAITGQPSYIIAAVLHNDDTAEFTRAQIAEKVTAFLERPVQQEG